jgi:hypothetical protein
LNLASLGLDALPEPVAVPDASPDYGRGLSWIQNYKWVGIGGLASLLIGSVGLYWRRGRTKQIATVPLYPEDASDPVASKLKILARQNPESISSIITRWVTDTEEAVV